MNTCATCRWFAGNAGNSDSIPGGYCQFHRADTANITFLPEKYAFTCCQFDERKSTHTDAEWYELYGRMVFMLKKYDIRKYPHTLCIAFEGGDRSEQLWNDMQQAVSHD